MIGERLYRRLWCAVAREQEHPAQADNLAARVAKPKRILQLISSGGYYGAESMLVNLAASLGIADGRMSSEFSAMRGIPTSKLRSGPPATDCRLKS